MLLGIALEWQKTELARIETVLLGDEPGDVRAPVIDGRSRRPRSLDRVEPRCGKGRARHEPFVRVDLDVRGVVHDQERGLVVEQDFLELVHETHLVSPVSRSEGEGFHLHRLLGVGGVVAAGREEITERAPSEKVGDEPDSLSVPGVEDGTRRPLAVQLLDCGGGPSSDVHLDLFDSAGP